MFDSRTNRHGPDDRLERRKVFQEAFTDLDCGFCGGLVRYETEPDESIGKGIPCLKNSLEDEAIESTKTDEDCGSPGG